MTNSGPPSKLYQIQIIYKYEQKECVCVMSKKKIKVYKTYHLTLAMSELYFI